MPPGSERKQPAGPARRGPTQLPEPADHAAAGALGLREARKQGRQRELVDVAGVDAREQGLGDVLDRLAAEPAAEEAPHRLVRAVAARQRQVRGEAQPAGGGEQAAGDPGGDGGRDAEDGTLGNGAQPAAEHVGGPGLERGQQPAFEPELAAQLESGRLLHQQRVGSRVEGEPVDALGADHAAGPRRRLDQHERGAPPLQLPGGGEARHPAADHRHVDVRHGPPPVGGLTGTSRSARARSGRATARARGWWPAGCRGRG